MAKQKGPLKYRGTLGEIKHFRIKGLPDHYAGLIGGPSAEQIYSDPAFARTRENMNEFAGSARAGKGFRAGLNSVVKRMSDPQFTGRVTSIMKKINLEDLSESRGYRAILISQQRHLLSGLNLNRNLSFDGVFYATSTVLPTVDRNEATWVIPPFTPGQSVSWPDGATHMRFIHVLGVVSDYAYDSQTKSYEPLDAVLNGVNTVAMSAYLPLNQATTTDTLVTAQLPGMPVLNADVTAYSAIGIEFYQLVGKEYVILNSGNAMKVASLY